MVASSCNRLAWTPRRSPPDSVIRRETYSASISNLRERVNMRSRSNKGTAVRRPRTSEMNAVLNSKRDQKWIDEAQASGPATPLDKKELDAIFKGVLRGKTAGRRQFR